MASEFKTGDLVRVRPSARTTRPGVYEVANVIRSSQEKEPVYVLRSSRDDTETCVPARHVARA